MKFRKIGTENVSTIFTPFEDAFDGNGQVLLADSQNVELDVRLVRKITDISLDAR